MPNDFIDVSVLRKPIASRDRGSFWRSLQELAETPEVIAALHREFPDGASQWNDEPSRRDFLKLMAASLVLAGANGCARPPDEKIVPYVEMPESFTPGKPLYFATAMPFAGYGLGLLVESHLGRPTKVEGNHLHPASLGATNAFAQASVLTLYDPDRSQAIRHHGAISTRAACVASLREQLEKQRAKNGAGLFVLTGAISSPSLVRQFEELRSVFPEFHWHQYEPVLRDAETDGAIMAFGEPVQTIYHFNRADVVLSLDADFLDVGAWPIQYARQFIERRRQNGSDSPQMNRLYVVESTPTLTGSKADHRLSLPPGSVAALARYIARKLGVDVGTDDSGLPAGISEAWINAVVNDLRNYRRSDSPGSSLVLAGNSQPADIHALVHAINQTLGNIDQTVSYIEPVLMDPRSQLNSLRDFVEALRAGQVDVLLILNCHPVFNAPADFEFSKSLESAPYCFHLGLYVDETAALCDWHVPATHFLEEWGDVRAFDGTASIVQPLIAPLYNGWSEHQVLAICLDRPDESAYEFVQSTWREKFGDNFEQQWEDALRQGVIPGTNAKPTSAVLRERSAQPGPSNTQSVHADTLTILFRPDPTIWDGSFANNGWLQELPKPLTKLTWDNAALIAPATAAKLELANGDVVRLVGDKQQVELPVWILPGQPIDCITVHFGNGRRQAGRVGTNVGADVFPLRTSDAMWSRSDVRIVKTADHYPLVSTQGHHGMEERHPVEHGLLKQLTQQPDAPTFMHRSDHELPSLYPPWPYDGYKWGMVIDLTACIGCGACVTACQAENNIPIVGKVEVGRGREMHWLRIDTYYQGDPATPEFFHQPVPCMHCEHAPCEVVCPVAATTHSDEGLNEMTYNRCIGTRYCSNNCPYKVRRFNFLQYADYESPLLKMLRNPNVTVRTRGVMEKCTYCVQRINAARIHAEKEDRLIRPGEVETACQAACPTQAILFGNLNDSQERVTQLRESPLNYSLLEELNTRPRTTYLAEIRNPNSEIMTG